MKKEYALFHCHRITKEIRRYPINSFPSLTKENAERMVKASKIAEAVSNTAYEWETVALKETN
jgi:hypothetical protein